MAFKYVPQPTATTFAFFSVFITASRPARRDHAAFFQSGRVYMRRYMRIFPNKSILSLVIVLFLLHVFSNGFPEFSLFYLAQQYARPSQKMKIRETVEFLPKNIVLFSRRYRNCLSNITGKIFNYSSEFSISIVYSFSFKANGEKYQKARNKTIKKQEWHIIKLLKSRNGA